jgi:hypothetical protein
VVSPQLSHGIRKEEMALKNNHQMSALSLTFFACVFSACFWTNSISAAFAGNVATIDRVVVMINSIPYTQTQIERYMAVKESLRGSPESAQIVQESNWGLALTAFIDDMMIHQEASKSSGFRPSRETIDKLRVRSERSLLDASALRSAFERLSLSRISIESEILRIATVENYRRSRTSMNGRGKENAVSWDSELKDRTIIRLFDDAQVWKSLDTKL